MGCLLKFWIIRERHSKDKKANAEVVEPTQDYPTTNAEVVGPTQDYPTTNAEVAEPTQDYPTTNAEVVGPTQYYPATNAEGVYYCSPGLLQPWVSTQRKVTTLKALAILANAFSVDMDENDAPGLRQPRAAIC